MNTVPIMNLHEEETSWWNITHMVENARRYGRVQILFFMTKSKDPDEAIRPIAEYLNALAISNEYFKFQKPKRLPDLFVKSSEKMGAADERSIENTMPEEVLPTFSIYLDYYESYCSRPTAPTEVTKETVVLEPIPDMTASEGVIDLPAVPDPACGCPADDDCDVQIAKPEPESPPPITVTGDRDDEIDAAIEGGRYARVGDGP